MEIKVIAHPNSKVSKIKKDSSGSLHAYVQALALEGKANQAVARLLAEYFGVKRYQIILVKGTKSKQKIFRVVSYEQK